MGIGLILQNKKILQIFDIIIKTELTHWTAPLVKMANLYYVIFYHNI